MITRVHIDILKKESLEKIEKDIEKIKRKGMLHFDKKGLCAFMYAIKSQNLDYMRVTAPYYIEHETTYKKNIFHLIYETKNDEILNYFLKLGEFDFININYKLLLNSDKNSRSPLLGFLKRQKGIISANLIDKIIFSSKSYLNHKDKRYYDDLNKFYTYNFTYYDRDGDNILKRIIKLKNKEIGLNILKKIINNFNKIDLNKKDLCKNKTNNKFEGFIETIIKENNIIFFNYIKENINNQNTPISKLNLNVINRNNETLLHLAGKNENYNIIKFLLKNGVNSKTLDRNNKKYIDYILNKDVKIQILNYENWLNKFSKINYSNIKDLEVLKDRKELMSKEAETLEELDILVEYKMPF